MSRAQAVQERKIISSLELGCSIPNGQMSTLAPGWKEIKLQGHPPNVINFYEV